MVPIHDNDQYVVNLHMDGSQVIAVHVGGDDLFRISSKLDLSGIQWVTTSNGIWGIRPSSISSIFIQKAEDVHDSSDSSSI